jgi:hypothetical protein
MNPQRSVVMALLLSMLIFAVARGKLAERVTRG